MTRFLTGFLSIRELPAILAIIAVGLVLPSIWTGWQQDDLIQRYYLLGNPVVTGNRPSPTNLFFFIDGDSTRTQRLIDMGVVPWWTLKTLRLSFWRPLASLTHWADYRLWPQSGVLMHMQSLLWFAAVVIMAALVYRRFLGLNWVAGLAALFFALDDAHGLPAGWIANRNGLIACLFGLLVLFTHDKWRRENWQPGRIAGPSFFLLGLLSGESALAVLGYLVGYAVFIDHDSVRARILTLLPYGLLAAVWVIVYTLLGYGTWGSGFYVDPLSEPVRFLSAFVWKAPVLLADQLALPPSSIVLFLPDRYFPILCLWALIVLVFIVILMYPLIRRDRVAQFWLTGMLLSIPLVCSTLPHGRLLMFAGIGAFAVLAQWIAGMTEEAVWIPEKKWWRTIARPMTSIFLLVHIVLAALMLPFNASSAAFAQAYIQDPATRVSAGREFQSQDLVILNHPIGFYGYYFPTARILAGQPSPRRVRILAPGVAPVHISRTDEYTLAVRPEGGYLHQPFDDVFRGPSHPLKRGEQISLTGLVVYINEITDDGRPAEATFRFSVPLSDPSLRWLRWEDRRYVEYLPPAVGDSAVVPGSPLLF